VIEWAYAKKDSAIADDKIRLQMADGVNTITGDWLSLLTNYEYRYFFSATAPDGGAWTDADIDALKIGPESDIV